jgi:hypothetical protein
MSFGNSFFGTPRTVLNDLEVDVSTLVADAVNDRIGIGDTAPGTTLQVKGEAPYVTIQNSTSENSDGGCESKIIFEDHANASLGQIEVSHSGSSDDTKGKMTLSTHTGSSLTVAVTIDEAQKVTAAGDVQVTGDIIIDDGGSLKEAGGTAAFTFDGSGHVTKIGQDSPSSGQFLKWDGSKAVWDAASGEVAGSVAADDISAGDDAINLTTTAGNITIDAQGDDTDIIFKGTDGGADTTFLTIDGSEAGKATFNDQVVIGDGKLVLNATAVGATAAEINAACDASARSAAVIAVADDHFMFLDGGATGDVKVESIADLVSGIAGTGLSASSGQLSYDGSLSGGALAFGNGQNATASVDATAHDTAGKNLTVTAGKPTAGTTSNIAGGSLTLQGGQGKGSGAGGDIVFQTANAAGSGSSLNAHATALTISDDKSATFTGHVIIAESTALKCGSADILSDSSGTMTLSNIDALDATTESTIEAAIDTLSNLTTVGTIGTGTWQGTAIASAYLDADTAHLSGTQTFTGAKTFSADVVISGTTPQLTIGDGGGEDTLLVFDGAAADWRMGIDDGTDILEIGVGASHGTTTAIGVNANAQTQVLAAFAANVAGTFGTFADGDGTPSVATGNLWKHHASSQTITMFDDGIAGQTIHVISTAAITYDVTGTNLKGGSTDIVTASGDITSWFFDGTNWYLIQFMDVSADMSSVGGGGGSTDLNGLDAATVDVAADSIGIIDANDSNNSKKESIADLASAMAGAGVTATNGVFSVTTGSSGPTPAASSAENIIAFQVFT